MGDQRVNIKNANHGPRVASQDIMEESAIQKCRLGSRLVVGDRIFRYCKNSTTALGVGKVVAAGNSLVTGTIYAAAGAEDSSVKITTTSVNATTYDEGYIVIDRGTGAGAAFKIKGTDRSTGTSYTQLHLYDCLPSGLTTTSQFKLIASRYNGLVVAAAGSGVDFIGIPLIAISPTAFAWVQTKGPMSVWLANSAGSTENARFLTLSATTSGALEVQTTGYVSASATSGAMTVYDFGRQVIAKCMTNAEALTTEVYNLVDLMLE